MMEANKITIAIAQTNVKKVEVARDLNLPLS